MLVKYERFVRFVQTSVFLITFVCVGSLRAQVVGGIDSAKTGIAADASAKKVDEFLATLRPSTSLKALESGNDLLLDFPAITAAGPIAFRAVSTIPRTDAMWLLSLHPQPDSGVPLLASIMLETSALPEISLLLNLAKTQSILLVVRAGGKYYGVQREIKVGLQMGASSSK